MSGRERPSRTKQPSQQERPAAAAELPSRSSQPSTTPSTSRVGSATSAIFAAQNAARGLTVGLARSARDLIPSFDSRAPFSQVESLSTVLFTPLSTPQIYKRETMEKALQLMQQQHKRTNDNNATDLAVRLKGSPKLPSSKDLLAIEIPDTQAPLSLFQGFHASYPAYSSHGVISKHHTRRKKHAGPDKRRGSVSDKGKGPSTLPRLQSQLVADKQKKQREYDKLQMNKLAITNQVSQIDAEIAELASRRKELEAKWAKLEIREMQIQDAIEDLTEAIVNYEDDHAEEILKVEDRKTKRKERESYDHQLDTEVETGTCLKTLYGHEDSIICLDFDHAGGSLVSSSYDASCRVWDLASQKCVGMLTGHTGIVRCLQVRENTHVYTGSDDYTIRHWDLSVIPPARSQSPSVMSNTSSPSQSPRLDPQSQGDIVPSITECCIDMLEGHNGPVTAIHADEHHLVSGSADKTMKQWDLETGSCIMTLDVLWSSQGRAGIVDWGTSHQDNDSNGIYGESVGDFVGALQFWNFALASGTVDGKIRMWDLRTGQSHRTLSGHSGPITALQFDEVHVVSGSLDRSIKIWDLRTGSIFDMYSYEGPITSLQFDSSKIACTASTKQIKIYNRTSFQHTVIEGHTQPVTSVRFRNNMIVSGGKDSVVKLWSLQFYIPFTYKRLMNKLHALNGVFAVNKPIGWTSRDVVNRVQNVLTTSWWTEQNLPVPKKKMKMGHGGTLDPIAEGVLVLGVGNGCKEMHEYLKGSKKYVVTIELGTATDTYDREGTITHRKDVKVSRRDIEALIPEFVGDQVWQRPPIYSALKMNGKKLYEYARRNIELPKEIQPRPVAIYQIDLTHLDDKVLELTVECGGGVYMRSLAHDLALRLGTYGHMTALKRTQQGSVVLGRDTTQLESLTSHQDIVWL